MLDTSPLSIIEGVEFIGMQMSGWCWLVGGYVAGSAGFGCGGWDMGSWCKGVGFSKRMMEAKGNMVSQR